jgi:hypothetical protein
MSHSDLSEREKWFQFLKGQDVGPMVSPLCDDWALNEPYRWPYEEPDPFPPGSPHHMQSQQMAMAGLCGWDPTFLAWVVYPSRNADALPETRRQETSGRTRVESCIHTPYGDLTSIEEFAVTSTTLKAWLETEEDYRKALWLTQQEMDYDEDVAIEEGRVICKGIGDRGILGTWFGPPSVNLCNYDQMFYHMADWPEVYEELHEVTVALALKKLRTFRKAGFDYLFYCVSGTEWISPGFFRAHIAENTREIFARWRAEGGFILWHTCGHPKTFLEAGIYNEFKPEIFETLSVRPLGDLPSLGWARQRLDPAIATKGNIPLDLLQNGSEEEIRTAVRQVREETRGYRHIVGLSDDILHDTPLSHCQAFVQAAREV